jgi:transposase
MEIVKTNLTQAAKEARRKLAVRNVLDGWTQANVAQFLGVHPVTVAKWMARHRADEEKGLDAKPVPGRPRFLTPKQEAEVLGWLTQKPSEFGFRTDLWTAARVAQLIKKRLGVQFHPGYLRNGSAHGTTHHKSRNDAPSRRMTRRSAVGLRTTTPP